MTIHQVFAYLCVGDPHAVISRTIVAGATLERAAQDQFDGELGPRARSRRPSPADRSCHRNGDAAGNAAPLCCFARHRQISYRPMSKVARIARRICADIASALGP